MSETLMDILDRMVIGRSYNTCKFLISRWPENSQEYGYKLLEEKRKNGVFDENGNYKWSLDFKQLNL